MGPDQTVVYTPAANFYGSDSFSYTLSDGHGGTATATVTVTVNPVNDPPAAVDDKANGYENAPATIDVLANDSDVEGDVLHVQSVTAPNNGSAAIAADGTITYTPNTGFIGTDSFQYIASDGEATATATVTITVEGILGPVTASFQDGVSMGGVFGHARHKHPKRRADEESRRQNRTAPRRRPGSGGTTAVGPQQHSPGQHRNRRRADDQRHRRFARSVQYLRVEETVGRGSGDVAEGVDRLAVGSPRRGGQFGPRLDPLGRHHVDGFRDANVCVECGRRGSGPGVDRRSCDEPRDRSPELCCRGRHGLRFERATRRGQSPQPRDHLPARRRGDLRCDRRQHGLRCREFAACGDNVSERRVNRHNLGPGGVGCNHAGCDAVGHWGIPSGKQQGRRTVRSARHPCRAGNEPGALGRLRLRRPSLCQRNTGRPLRSRLRGGIARAGRRWRPASWASTRPRQRSPSGSLSTF